ncbi:hypothetical protein P7K49_004835, partial [Saguinus oedipus]
PQRPTAPRRTSPTPEEEGGKLRQAGGEGTSSGNQRRLARPGEGPGQRPWLQPEGRGEESAPSRYAKAAAGALSP